MTTSIEDQLRAELAREAARVQAADVRPLAVAETPDGRAGWRGLSLAAVAALGRPRAGRRVIAWLAPAAAVVAILAVIAGVMVAGAGAGARHPAGSGPVNTGSPAAMPRFYVSLSYASPRWRAVVHDARSGRALSSQVLPPTVHRTRMLPSVVAAGDDRTFAIVTAEHPATGPSYVQLIQLHLRHGGQVGQLYDIREPLPAAVADSYVTGAALSGDGSKLAVTLQIPGRAAARPGGAILVISQSPNWATRIWTSAVKSQMPLDPAWQAGGRYLGFLLWSHIRATADTFTAHSQVRLLDTAAAGRDMLAARVIAAGGHGRGFLQNALLSPDGRSVIVATYRNVAGSQAGHGTAHLAVEELAVPGGRVRQQFCVRSDLYTTSRQQNAADSSVAVLAIAPRGRHSLVVCPGMGRLDNGRFTPLPGLPAVPIVAW
jgi:hypothetical protein